jgi:hypothetical protein
MDEIIEKYAMQCTSWPYWRDLPNDANEPSALVTEWPSHVTEEQKTFWRTFVNNLINDLKENVSLVDNSKLDQILSFLNK